MKKIAFLLLISSACLAQTKSANEYYADAKEAYKIANPDRFYELIQHAYALHPYHQGILYHYALAAALVNKPDEALHYLTRAVYIDAEFDLENTALKTLFSMSDFIRLKEARKKLTTPIILSDTAFILKDRQLHLETITPGETTGTFYLGSIHKRKIIKVDEHGSARDFTASAQDGLTAVMGLCVNKQTNSLWACASPLEEMKNYDTTQRAAVYRYDLTSKKLTEKYVPDDSLKGCVFGDLTLNSNGQVFISDSKNNIIFTLNRKQKKLEIYFTSNDFWNIQGITFSHDNKYLFIADYVKGIFRLETSSKKLIHLSQEFDPSTKAIDGLRFYNNSLIAIQNAVNPMRVTQYYLSDSSQTLKDFKIIDRNHPAFNEPTNGCIVNHELYYIANSQWSGYDQLHNIKPDDQLKDIVILKYDLKKAK
jgi:sugar lactone lactonase YvrE